MQVHELTQPRRKNNLFVFFRWFVTVHLALKDEKDAFFWKKKKSGRSVGVSHWSWQIISDVQLFHYFCFFSTMTWCLNNHNFREGNCTNKRIECTETETNCDSAVSMSLRISKWLFLIFFRIKNKFGLQNCLSSFPDGDREEQEKTRGITPRTLDRHTCAGVLGVTTIPTKVEVYVTQVFKEIEGRVVRKVSHELGTINNVWVNFIKIRGFYSELTGFCAIRKRPGTKYCKPGT